MACPKCDRDHKRSKNGLCPSCAMKAYRATEEGDRAYRDAKARYERSEKGRAANKRAQRRWRENAHQLVPEEVYELRRASKRLEEALADSN